MPDTDADRAGEIARRLAAIWDHACGTVLDRVNTIASAATALGRGSLSADARRAAEVEAHKLAGVAATFGFPDATSLAREAERLLSGEDPISEAAVARLTCIADKLHQVFACPPRGVNDDDEFI